MTTTPPENSRPLPGSPELRRFYESTVVMGADHVESTITTTQLRQFRRHAVTPTTVLDLGCGAGSNTLALFGDRPAVAVTGVDISRKAVATYRQRTGRDAVLGVGESLPFPDGSFDLVVCNDVIEHVVDTDRFAEEIRRVLQPGGHLALSTPNLAAWFNRLALFAGVQPAFSEVSTRAIFGRRGADVVGHLRLFTPSALTAFLRYHGFELLDRSAASFPALPGPVRPLDRVLAARSFGLGAISVVLASRPA